MLMGGYIVFMVIDKDELEEKAQSYALKGSNLLTVISLILYVLYKSVEGDIGLSLHVILIFINILCVLYLILNFLYLKGIIISFNIKNIKILNIICYLSIGISAVLIFTGFLKVKIFQLSSSFIRLDTLLMMINLVIVSLMIGLYPRKKLSRQEYKKREVIANKFSKIFAIGYGLFFLWVIGYIVYRFYTK
jgi:NADH:ubiquinone oxidoreductase subunit 6 (subunit J)